ncbi:MAG: ABC transporter substrate-binding protein [Oligoflexia bacterium]|nr:ABC transporter substrate-binding protein [Oligoflexia bacterium]
MKLDQLSRWATPLMITWAVCAIMTTSCTHKKHPEDAKLAVFSVALVDDVKTMDPANAYDSVSNDVLPNILESPYQYSYLSDTVKVEPLLAASMPQYSKDRLTLTVPLRHGIHFADDTCFKATNGKGRELVAQDLVNSIKRLAIPSIDSQGWWILDGKVAGINAFRDSLTKAGNYNSKEFAAAFAQPVEGIKAIDDYTVQFKLLKPYPQLVYILTMGFTSVIPHEAVEAYADEKGNIFEHPVGTGPFMLKRWDRNHEIVLDRNPGFHPDFYPTQASAEFQRKGYLADTGKTLPFLDRIRFEIIKEGQPTWLGFLKGDQDAIQLPKDNMAQAIVNRTNLAPDLEAKGIRLTIETGVTVFYVSFNMKDKLVGSNKYLRQALSSAIDREQLIDLFTNGTSKKQVTALPPGVADRPDVKEIKYDYNLARAKELLKKAGYPDGKGLPPLTIEMQGSATTDRQLGDFFTKAWSAIGVHVTPSLNTFPAYLEKMKHANFQISSDGWVMDYPDGENIYQLLYGQNASPGPANANFNNPEMNKLYSQMAVMESGPARAAIVAKMDEIQQEEVPWALGYYYARYDLSHPWISNYRTGDIIQNRYKYFRTDAAIRKRYLGN